MSRLTVVTARRDPVPSDQPCGDGAHTGCAAINDPNATMMGDAQEKWLYGLLPTVKSTWTLISQQVPMFMRDNIKAAPDGQFSMDKWDAYTAARRRLFTQLSNSRAANPVVLSGDVHLAYASDLKMDFRNPNSQTVGVEFTGTSVSSGGDGTDVSATWDMVKGDNPHIKFHSAKRGYLDMTATPGEIRADFMVIDKVTEPNRPAKRVATGIVTAGKPGLQMA